MAEDQYRRIFPLPRTVAEQLDGPGVFPVVEAIVSEQLIKLSGGSVLQIGLLTVVGPHDAGSIVVPFRCPNGSVCSGKVSNKWFYIRN